MSERLAAGQTSPVIVLYDEIHTTRSSVSLRRLATAASNICLALLFFSELFHSSFTHTNNLSNLIWIAGAAMMGLFALVRVAPTAERINLLTIGATGGMMLIPLLMRPAASPSGWFYVSGIALEMIGIIITQASRLFLGRSFGLLPANRGVVTRGPYRLVRHPVYLGWLVLTIGFGMINPSWRNVAVTIAILPFMFARIEQEEALLEADSEYRVYSDRTRYRLVPGLY
ncbi:MAG TPA: isoprenylcysteine carboxylmethyltransferase family protein [Candidatus Binataceae bacterium]|nr:isoprenylcysteine carboxylmethyltransferase family protein [Candidatus Binataceae bacterium]